MRDSFCTNSICGIVIFICSSFLTFLVDFFGNLRNASIVQNEVSCSEKLDKADFYFNFRFE